MRNKVSRVSARFPWQRRRVSGVVRTSKALTTITGYITKAACSLLVLVLAPEVLATNVGLRQPERIAYLRAFFGDKGHTFKAVRFHDHFYNFDEQSCDIVKSTAAPEKHLSSLDENTCVNTNWDQFDQIWANQPEGSYFDSTYSVMYFDPLLKYAERGGTLILINDGARFLSEYRKTDEFRKQGQMHRIKAPWKNFRADNTEQGTPSGPGTITFTQEAIDLGLGTELGGSYSSENTTSSYFGLYPNSSEIKTLATSKGQIVGAIGNYGKGQIVILSWEWTQHLEFETTNISKEEVRKARQFILNVLGLGRRDAGFDFGDAPDTGSATGSGNYSTMLKHNGPRHKMPSQITAYLGNNKPDKDSGSLQSTDADADDSGDTDDEDGAVFSGSLVKGTALADVLTLKANRGDAKGDVYVNGWIDYNRDGDFDDTGEQIINDLKVKVKSAGSPISVSLPADLAVPDGASTGISYARFRVCTQKGNCSKPTGEAADGEVEDYKVSIDAKGVNISGVVFKDNNRNGEIDSAESGIANVTVVLYSSDNSSCLSVTTNANGGYTFKGIESGTYELIEAASETTPKPASCPPTPADPTGYVSTTENTRLLVVTATDVQGQNFGDIASSQIGGTVFIDNGAGSGTAHDGKVNGDEQGIAGTALRVVNAANNLVYGRMVTDGAGHWQLILPIAAVGQALRIELLDSQSAHIPISEGVSSLPSLVNSANSADSVVQFTPVAGGVYTAINFGEVSLPSLVADKHVSATPGSVVNVPHRYQANTLADVTFSIANKQNASDDFSVSLLEDKNCNQNIDAGETVGGLLKGIVSHGQVVCLIARIQVSSAAADGSELRYDIVASSKMTSSAPGVFDTVVKNNNSDIVSLGSGTVTLVKTVASCATPLPETDCSGDARKVVPGAILEYFVRFRNLDNEAANNVNIFDRTPVFSRLQNSVRCPTKLPVGASGCSIVSPETRDNKAGYIGPIQWRFVGKFEPGVDGVVSFRVRIDQN